MGLQGSLRQDRGMVRRGMIWGNCVHHRESLGRSDFTWNARWSNGRRRRTLGVDEAEATGHSRANQWHGEMRQDVWSMCAWSIRKGAALGRRNLHRSIVGTEAV